MVKLVMEEYEQRPTLPADSIVLLKLEEVKVRDVKGGSSGSFQKLDWKFKILDVQTTGDGSPKDYYETLLGAPIYGSTPFRFNSGADNKLKQWTEIILGMELEIGFELDTDLLEGKQVRGVTSTYDKRAIDPATNLPFKGMQIDSLLPFNGQVLGGGSGWAPSPSSSFMVPPAAQPSYQPEPAYQPQPAYAQSPAAQPNPGYQPAAAGPGWSDEPPF